MEALRHSSTSSSPPSKGGSGKNRPPTRTCRRCSRRWPTSSRTSRRCMRRPTSRTNTISSLQEELAQMQEESAQKGDKIKLLTKDVQDGKGRGTQAGWAHPVPRSACLGAPTSSYSSHDTRLTPLQDHEQPNDVLYATAPCSTMPTRHSSPSCSPRLSYPHLADLYGTTHAQIGPGRPALPSQRKVDGPYGPRARLPPGPGACKSFARRRQRRCPLVQPRDATPGRQRAPRDQPNHGHTQADQDLYPQGLSCSID
ncbi:hypothetical protein CALVIDRAFT_371836 [Calocera viscosa TUFC12733]|uniref:Uncharacterized protein n=1 Tax=Calocera viscosa (strain TUFC12733) TaxID=1330018 RepID=A0A167GT73_CALVF|nr:hypothetical protein CALVIDRAFT_371836 [Calocera viscosa TUFC12733]